MKVSKMLALASVTGIVAAGAVATPAFAWHPKGEITKSVQNQTSGSPLSDANTASEAVAAKPGDTLKYVIEVRNSGATGKSNEMHFTKLTDTLPDGVQLIADPAKRTISEDLGTIAPGQKVTKEYLVKVTATKDGTIENKACFTGDSEVKDNPQQGCEVATVKVTTPPKEEPPKEQPKPEAPAPQVLSTATELPHTGASAVIAPIAAFTSGAAAYAGRLLVVKRRQK
jgi:uncharacterized repeat protein (TIGR01451 family)